MSGADFVEDAQPAQRRRELLRRRLAAEKLATSGEVLHAGPPREAGKGYPLSPGQRRMWFLQQLNPSSIAYNVCAAFTVSGHLDDRALHEGLCSVVRRHDILRTTYRADPNGVPEQVVHPDLPVPWSLHDVRGCGSSGARRSAEIAAAESRHVFDLALEAPLRVTLIRSGEHEHTLILIAHHIAWDNDSWGVFFRDLMDAYEAARAGDPPAFRQGLAQYMDVAVQPDKKGTGNNGLDYWRRQLIPLPRPLELPGAHGSWRSGEEAGRQHAVDFPSSALQRIRELAGSEKCTPYMVLLAAFSGVLHRYTGATDFVIGSPVVNREATGARDLVGYFGNMVPLRTRPAPGDTFRGLIAQTRDMCSGAFSHQDVDFEQIVKLDPHRTDGVTGIFSVLFALRSPAAEELRTKDFSAVRRELHNGTAQFPLSVVVETTSDTFAVEVTYLVELLPAELVEQFVRHFELFVVDAVRDPDQRLDRIGGFSDQDVRHLTPRREAATGGDGAQHVAEPQPPVPGPPTPGPPVAATQDILAGLFADVLRKKTVDIDRSFFELGGDSILAIQLVNRARSAGVVITANEVFEHRTVRGLAAAARSAAGPEAPSDASAAIGPVPLTPMIRWLLDRTSSFSRFAQAVVLNTPATLDAEGLHSTVQAVLERHDALRSRLRHTGPDSTRPDWVFEVTSPGAVRARDIVCRIEVSGDWAAEGFARLLGEQLDAAAGRLDPAAGVMLQMVWFDAGSVGGRLLVVAHHLVVDGVSWRILLPDLAAAWQQIQLGGHPDLPPVLTSLREWAHALDAHSRDPVRMAELATWRRVLHTPDPPLGQRRLNPQCDLHSTVREVRVRLPADVTGALLGTVPAAFYAGVADVLLTGLALAVTRRRRQTGAGGAAVLFTTEGHGREQRVIPGADLSRTVGWFTSLFPVRLDLEGVDVDEAFLGGPAAGVALKRVKEQLRSVPDGGLGFGLLRRLNPGTATVLSADPTPQISFNYLGRFDLSDEDWALAAEFGVVRAAADPTMPAAACLDITAVAEDGPGGTRLSAVWAFPAGVLTESEVGALAQLWCDALTGLVEHTERPDSGGRTPSDLPLVSLSQDQLDALEARWRKP